MHIDDFKPYFWLIGNTGLRNPERIKDGFKVFANSIYVGNLRGENEKGFMALLAKEGIIHTSEGKDPTGSHARKWRLMFEKHGLIYHKFSSKKEQEQLGPADDITPFGKDFLRTETPSETQEFFLRAQSVAKEEIPDTDHLLFSPLRWTLAIMLALEKKTGTSAIGEIEFALWVQSTDPRYNINQVVERILDLRRRRKAIVSGKKQFDKNEINRRLATYDKKKENAREYADLNMRYLRATGIVQREGKGLKIVPAKHVLAETLASAEATDKTLIEQYRLLCTGAPLPSDNLDIALSILDDLVKQLKTRKIVFDEATIDRSSIVGVLTAIHRAEMLLSDRDEEIFAEDQRNQWQEISDYMKLLEKGGGTLRRQDASDDNEIVVPKDEAASYMEWTLWRAMLAIDNLKNRSQDVRGFNLDADLRPISTATGGRGDLYCEFEDFMILTEVTLSSSSRQEAMEGEPVRRHVSDAREKYCKPVLGLFIATKINTNTAETFRHSVWYTSDDNKTRLDIVPLTLEQFRCFFVAMFRANQASPDKLRNLILQCEETRDSVDAPTWKVNIAEIVDKAVKDLEAAI